MTVKSQNKAGFTLVFTLVAISALSVLVTALYGFNSVAYTNAGRLVSQTQARELARGGIDRALHQLSYNPNYTGESDVSPVPAPGVVDITVVASNPSTRQITAQSFIPTKQNPQITYRATASATASQQAQGSAFSYALQVGQGGFYASGNPHISGSIYSNENISISGAGSSVSGSASAVGTVSIAGSVGSINEGVAPAPLTDVNFNAWRDEAMAHGTPNVGDLAISDNNPRTLGGDGNISFITGRLLISGNPTITLRGSVMVQRMAMMGYGGSIEISGNPTFVIPADYPSNTLALIAEKTISISGNPQFKTDKPGAWILFASQNPGSVSPDTTAINISSNPKFYAATVLAPYGKMVFGNGTSGVHAKTFEAQKIQIDSNLTIDYDQGLASISFEQPDAPSGGGFVLTPGSYGETIP